MAEIKLNQPLADASDDKNSGHKFDGANLIKQFGGK